MTSISENVHIDELDYIVNEYNDTYLRTIKMMLMIIHILTQAKKLIIKILNFKLVIM